MVGPEVISHRVGQTEANLRRVFQEATTLAPCLILIDEIDAIAPKREASTSDVEKRWVVFHGLILKVNSVFFSF